MLVAGFLASCLGLSRCFRYSIPHCSTTDSVLLSLSVSPLPGVCSTPWFTTCLPAVAPKVMMVTDGSLRSGAQWRVIGSCDIISYGSDLASNSSCGYKVRRSTCLAPSSRGHFLFCSSALLPHGLALTNQSLAPCCLDFLVTRMVSQKLSGVLLLQHKMDLGIGFQSHAPLTC